MPDPDPSQDDPPASSSDLPPPITSDVTPTPARSEETNIKPSRPESTTLPKPTTLPLATLSPSLNPIPTSGNTSKPRSNSVLHSTRPAPPSPVPSRPPSLVLPATGKQTRDRAGSQDSSSSTSHSLSASRRESSDFSPSSTSTSTSISGGGGGGGGGSGVTVMKRNSSRQRPRSSLGTSSLVPEVTRGEEDGQASGAGEKRDDDLSKSSIPEGREGNIDPTRPLSESPISGSTTPTPSTHLSPADTTTPASLSNTTSQPETPPNPSQDASIPIIIRDYAFPPSDERYLGIHPPPPPVDEEEEERGGGSGATTPFNEGSWTGFGLLSWRFGGRSRQTSVGGSTPASGGGGGQDGGGRENQDEDEDEEDDSFDDGEGGYRVPLPDHTDDDYAFSSGSEAELPIRHDFNSFSRSTLSSSHQSLSHAHPSTSSSFYNDAADDDDDFLEDEEKRKQTEPWGWYRADYSFKALGENEIDLTEGEMVYLRGRGVGEGWVVAVRGGVTGDQGEGEEGLVPLTYLEKIDFDI